MKRKKQSDKNTVTGNEKYKYEKYPSLNMVSDELWYYSSFFKDMNIYCPCDFIYNNDNETGDYENNIFSYLDAMMEEWGIKKLVYTQFCPMSHGILTVSEIKNGKKTTKRTPMSGYGDFDSSECEKFMNECDIVVASPRYDTFRETVSKIHSFGKKFIVLGDERHITCKEIFPILKGKNLWYGINRLGEMFFELPLMYARMFSNEDRNRRNVRTRFGKLCIREKNLWMTNIKHKKYIEEFDSYSYYKGRESSYPKYVNYEELIDVSRNDDLPMDYDGIMAVPHTFLSVYTPRQFDIVGCLDINDVPKGWKTIGREICEEFFASGGTAHISEGSHDAIFRNSEGKLQLPFKRILIKKSKKTVA